MYCVYVRMCVCLCTYIYIYIYIYVYTHIHIHTHITYNILHYTTEPTAEARTNLQCAVCRCITHVEYVHHYQHSVIDGE